ncbi:ABC transporter ATP-binding protein [Halosquirtibacter xylanolyticus]|uniref:ABC transporter ATP-binding protein n=1 Tax=Halosquirtibacter xylanolyticus TaxID=3374599 RepID=UPI003748FFA0|nr:ABC transporter ATP-binding protein [Prolixibacteraceae bacterium]
MEKMIQIKDLHYKVSNKEILKGVDLEINEGDIFALLGVNGSGKSTLIDLVLKDISPSKGEVIYSNKISPKFDNVGVVYDKLPLFMVFTVDETIKYFCAIYRTSFKEIEKRYYRLFQLTEIRKSLVEKLSHGEKKRLCLLLSILTPKELLILDEPFANLDPPMIELMWKTLKNESQTIFFSTHHWKEVQHVATKVAFIHQGHIIGQVDSPKNILSQFDNKKVVISSSAKSELLMEELKTQQHYLLDEEIHLLQSPENGALDLVTKHQMNYSIQDVTIIDAYLFEGNKLR